MQAAIYALSIMVSLSIHDIREVVPKGRRAEEVMEMRQPRDQDVLGSYFKSTPIHSV